MRVPAADLLAYSREEYEEITPAFLFFRKVILLLVCDEDLLRSVVDTGKFRGGDVMSRYESALDKVLIESASKADDTGVYVEVLTKLRTDKATQKRRGRVRWLFFWFIGFLGAAWYTDRLQPLYDTVAWLQRLAVGGGGEEDGGVDYGNLHHGVEYGDGGSSDHGDGSAFDGVPWQGVLGG